MKRKFLIGLAMSLVVAVTMTASATPEPQNVQGLSASSETFHVQRPSRHELPPFYVPEVSETPQVTTDPWAGLDEAIEQEKIRLYVEAVEKAEAEEAAREAARQAEAARKAEEARQAALAAPPPPPPPAAPTGSVWDALAGCEANGNWHINTGNGYYGGLQFALSSWRDVGGTGYPHEHSREEQINRGKMLQAKYGWGAWPACSKKLGLR